MRKLKRGTGLKPIRRLDSHGLTLSSGSTGKRRDILIRSRERISRYHRLALSIHDSSILSPGPLHKGPFGCPLGMIMIQ
jgi:hypothetical protein